jgi:hypothetical protein
MNDFIEKRASLSPRLSYRLNKGNINRVFRHDLHGSLWVSPRVRTASFDLLTDGEVASVLNPELVRRFGPNTSENTKGYKIWKVRNRHDVELVIDYFGQI